MKIVQVASEVAPFSKSGGLADVVGALSRGLAGAGHTVWTVSPRYRGVAEGARPTGIRIAPSLGSHPWPATLSTLSIDGVQHLFVDHPSFDRDGLYGDDHGPFGDNHQRFALLCHAALAAARHLAGDAPVIHAHDWQAALLPIYLEADYRPLGLLTEATTVLTLHNPMHQGRLPASCFTDLDLSGRWFAPSGLEFHGDLGLLKGGILHADQLTTVSPTFAREVLTAGGGFGLDTVLAGRAVDLTGILNGLDVEVWDPSTDAHLPARYTAADLAGKVRCKADLQAELGLPIDPDAPLVGLVSRLDPQKGIALILDIAPQIAQAGAQLVVVGTASAAHRHFEERLVALAEAHPHNIRAWIGYSEAMAHRVQGGADLFVMPSVFEPCGLTQLAALRYGTPPVVRRTGGLADSVIPYDPRTDRGTGFLFGPPTAEALREALWRAMALFTDDPVAFAALQRRGMAVDSSWAQAVPAYIATYDRARALRAG